ncbi:MAG: hypothetical protein IJR63_06505 [Synergistaceae bacterium]|nr:hypothetical protein [Synergistaceae bacterium]
MRQYIQGGLSSESAGTSHGGIEHEVRNITGGVSMKSAISQGWLSMKSTRTLHGG